jgi:hypothetical protein
MCCEIVLARVRGHGAVPCHAMAIAAVILYIKCIVNEKWFVVAVLKHRGIVRFGGEFSFASELRLCTRDLLRCGQHSVICQKFLTWY